MPRFCNSRGREATVREESIPAGNFRRNPPVQNSGGRRENAEKSEKKSDSDLRTAQKRDIKPGNTENMRRTILIMES